MTRALGRFLGDVLLWLAFRVHSLWLDLEVVHPERAARIPTPSLIVFNYQAPYVGLAVLHVIPRRVRRRIAVAADASAWSGSRRWQGRLIELAVGAFPMAKSGRGIRTSLERMRHLLNDGHAVLLSPEGTPSMSEDPGTFLTGVGLMAVATGVPIVPFRIEGYSFLYPRYDPGFPWLPIRRGRARLFVGEPLAVPPGADRHQVTELARRAILELR